MNAVVQLNVRNPLTRQAQGLFISNAISQEVGSVWTQHTAGIQREKHYQIIALYISAKCETLSPCSPAPFLAASPPNTAATSPVHPHTATSAPPPHSPQYPSGVRSAQGGLRLLFPQSKVHRRSFDDLPCSKKKKKLCGSLSLCLPSRFLSLARTTPPWVRVARGIASPAGALWALARFQQAARQAGKARSFTKDRTTSLSVFSSFSSSSRHRTQRDSGLTLCESRLCWPSARRQGARSIRRRPPLSRLFHLKTLVYVCPAQMRLSENWIFFLNRPKEKMRKF